MFREHFKSNWHFCFLIFLFFSLNILNFINSGLYWDDWWLISLSPEDLVEMYRQVGIPFYSTMHGALLKSENFIWLYRGLFVALSCITTFSIYSILKRILKDSYFALIATAFFIALPLNIPKIIIICFPYVLCSCFFFSAFSIAISERRNWVTRILALILFFISFLTGSYFFLYVIFILSLLYLNDFFNLNLSHKRLIILKNLDFFLTPLVYLYFKFYILPQPSGEYGGYNTIKFSYVGLGDTIELIQLYLESFFIVMKLTLTKIFSMKYLLISSIVSLMLVSVFFKKKIEEKSGTIFLDLFLKLVILSFGSLFFGILPYLLIGRNPLTFGMAWGGRDELLFPFGISILLLIPISLGRIRPIQKYLFTKMVLLVFVPVTFLLCFSYSTIRFQVQFLQDMIKQDALFEFYRESSDMAKTRTYHFIDAIPEYNIFQRSFGNSELNGMAQFVFKTQDRYFNLTSDVTNVCPEKLKIGIICKNWKRSDIDRTLIVSASDEYLDKVTVLKLAFLKLINLSAYKEQIKRFFKIELIPFK